MSKILGLDVGDSTIGVAVSDGWTVGVHVVVGTGVGLDV